MEDEINKIIGVTLDIIPKSNDDALIKVLDKRNIYYFIVKSYYKIENKNRPNISIGSISEFIYFPNYGRYNTFLLQKAHLIKFLNFYNINNKDLENLLFIFKQTNEFCFGFFSVYLQFLKLKEQENLDLSFINTYLFFLIIATKGYKFHTLQCAICKSNQNLYCINLYEGGMLCVKHKRDWLPTPTQILKAFYFINISFLEFVKNSSPSINYFLWDLIKKFF